MQINFYILLGCIFISLVTEITVNAFKSFMPETRLPIVKLLAVAVGIGIAVLADMDLFVAFDYPLNMPYVGSVITGVICSLGASAIYDLYEGMKDYRDRLAQEKANTTE